MMNKCPPLYIIFDGYVAYCNKKQEVLYGNHDAGTQIVYCSGNQETYETSILQLVDGTRTFKIIHYND